MGTRVGANASQFAPQGRGERLATALGDRESRERLLADAGGLTGTALYGRIRTLTDELLA
ncbi:hypothetical protein [Amycolatopsis sp. cmx-8-4]|uniref:hypothetical protein n=1 Tax=Amycolatopsis sp. cmx-8-4 TaxID=2790947 RepID=UPI003978B944